jgi:Sortase domain
MRLVAVARVATVLALTAAAAVVAAESHAAVISGSSAAASSVVEPPPAAEFRSVRSYPVVAEPVRLRIPAAGVDTSLVQLGRAADGSIEVPSDFDVAGWFADGPRPGEPGPAVILGHVDSRTGPAVFFRVGGLAPNAQVLVDRADGSTVAFRVRSVQHVPKVAFPTDFVYAPTLEPSLRLVTCGGSFDRAAESYRDNVIVYADPA